MELDVRDVAAILQVPEYTVYKLVVEDKLPAMQINGQYRFNREELLEWASARSVNPIGIVTSAARKSATEVSLCATLAVAVLTTLHSMDKGSVLRAAVERLPLPDGMDRESLLQMLLAREKAGSTAVGNGIAIPHSRYPVVLPIGRPLLAVCYLEQPVAFGAGALGQVDTVFVLVTPTIAVHLQMLARLAAFVQDDVVKRLLKERAPLDRLVQEAQRIENEAASGKNHTRVG